MLSFMCTFFFSQNLDHNPNQWTKCVIFSKKLPNWFFMYPPAFSYLHMLQTFHAMSTNSMENNIALIILHCCPIATSAINHLCNHFMHGHSKNKNHQYFVPTLIHCV
jgi:hypothetical protein